MSRKAILSKIQTRLAGLCETKSHRTEIDFLTLYKTTRKTDPVLFVYEPRIYIVIQGQKEISVLDRRYVYNETQYLVSTIDIPVSGMITEHRPRDPIWLCVFLFHRLKFSKSFQPLAALLIPRFLPGLAWG